MPENAAATGIRDAWIAFTTSLRSLLVVQTEDRALDQYLVFRDNVLNLVQREEFLKEVEKAWSKVSDFPLADVGDAFQLELKAFLLSIEVAQAAERTAAEPIRGWSRLLSRGSTTIGSFKDLLNSVPDWARGSLILLKELLDLFNAKE